MLVSDNEHFSRWVYAPRYLTDEGLLNDKFISLRPQIKEKGVSGQLCDRIDFATIVSDGNRFIRVNANGDAIESLKYVAKANVADIRNIALWGDTVDVVKVPSQLVHEHAEIIFMLDGMLVDALCKDAKLLYYFDELKILLGKCLIEV